VAETRTKALARLKMIAPQFAVPDVTVAAEYYRDVLGFKILGYWLDPPIYAIVERDAVVIHFGKLDRGVAAAPNITRREGSIDAYIWVDDVDALYAELQSRGAKVVERPTTQVYKSYEMIVEDHLGFRLAFAMNAQNT